MYQPLKSYIMVINNTIVITMFTMFVLVGMTITHITKLINIEWWHYIVVGYVLPNISMVTWLLIAWIRFNPNETIKK